MAKSLFRWEVADEKVLQRHLKDLVKNLQPVCGRTYGVRAVFAAKVLTCPETPASYATCAVAVCAVARSLGIPARIAYRIPSSSGASSSGTPAKSLQAALDELPVRAELVDDRDEADRCTWVRVKGDG